MEALNLHAADKERIENSDACAGEWSHRFGGRCSCHVPASLTDLPLLVVRRSSKPPWPTYSTSWATPAVGSSSWTPSARAVTNLSVPIEELGASRQAEQPAACRRAGILRVSGSGRMPCVPCVLPRPGTLCSMLACVSAGVVCHCLCVSSDGVFAVPVVCDRKRADAAVR